MRKRISFIICLLITTMFATAQTDTVYKPVEYPAGFTSQLNVVYTKVGSWEGKMDIYLPPAGNGPTPVLINIHGGGWNKGVKESQTGFNTFFKAGFAVANIEYRLSQQATAPAAIEDARCALIYLIKHAKDLNIDANRIVIMGGSAGGHLALMAGLLANDHRFDGNCPGVENIKVAAIINKYGIVSLWDWAYGPHLTSRSATQWLGAKSKDEAFAKTVSPISYVNSNNPPTFIVHGDADPTVPYQHSVELNKQMESAGVKTKFITIPGGLHGKFTKEQNSAVNREIIAFLKSINVIR
ncbi:MAG TPA: alpha/beta hydrolase [Chitinophagaceae bacterium]